MTVSMKPRVGAFTEAARRVDVRSVVMFVVLDQLTYMLVYWLVYPAFAEVLAAIPEATVIAVNWVVSAVRLVFIALITARSYRSRRGLVSRAQVVPTVLVAACAGWALHLVLGLVARAVMGVPGWSWAMLLDLVTWVAFALLALLFVSPGEADRLPLRYRAAAVATGDRGATNLLLIPAVAGLVAASLLVITVLGSATDTARESRTAADAAALAAAGAWRDRVENAFGIGVGASGPEDFWGFAGTDLGALGSWRVADAAHRYARANGAEVLAVSVDPVRAQVTVRVRNLDPVPGTGDRIESVKRPRFSAAPMRVAALG